MTESPRYQPGSTPSGKAEQARTGRDASSPYDEPTERIPQAGPGRSIPHTDDDLGPDPTEQLPAYRPGTAHEQPQHAPPTQRFDTSPQPVATAAPAEVPSYNYSSQRDKDLDSADTRGRGTLDLGLLILRISVGGLFFFHGLMKLTGWGSGPGLDKMSDMVEAMGWKQPQISSVLLMVGETAGGALLILGLATPLAAGAVLAVIIDAWLVRQGMQPGLQFTAPNGPEYETLLVAAAAALILTGPGRISLDGNRGWATRPAAGSLLVLVLAIAAAAAMWIFAHGGNPFV